MLTEARDLAEEIGDIEIQAEAMEWRVAALMALGDIDAGAARARARARDRAADAPAVHPPRRRALRVGACAARGRLEEAEAAAERSREWGQLLTGRDASGIYGIQMFGVRREQGRLAELAPVIRVLAADERGESGVAARLAALLAELGMDDEARRELARVREDGLEPLREALWIASLTYLADAASAVGDRDVAELALPGARAARRART